MKKNVVITCANNKIGDFLCFHWLKSLKENNNLENIDIVVIDYGLTKKQKNILLKDKVILFNGLKKYHIINKRFFDAENFLKNKNYDQVLFIDGGDIIFQEDINHLFKKDKKYFRVVILDKEILFFKALILNLFDKKNEQKIWKFIKNKPIINAGVILAPKNKFIKLCQTMKKMIKNKESFGPDQIILNYFLYKNNCFKLIDNKYNFMIAAEKKGFLIKKGLFYKTNGEKITIVHNCGQMNFFRPIENFGYKTSKYKIKYFIYYLKIFSYEILKFLKKIRPKEIRPY